MPIFVDKGDIELVRAGVEGGGFQAQHQVHLRVDGRELERLNLTEDAHDVELAFARNIGVIGQQRKR